MKSYIGSCTKSLFKPIERIAYGKYIVRWNVTESVDEELAIITVRYNETVFSHKPSFGEIVDAIIKEKYSVSDEQAILRQSYNKVDDFVSYNAYVEQAKKWASEAMGIEYSPMYDPTTAEVISQVRTFLKSTAKDLSDDKAETVPALFDPWENGILYNVGDRRYNSTDGKLYKCIQQHTSQADWRPDIATSLWVKVSTDEWPEWVQPTGSHDAYPINAKVTCDSKHWINVIENNVYKPGVYGWNIAE